MTVISSGHLATDQAADMVPQERKRRSGSERRERGRLITFRLSQRERAELEAAADASGLTLGSYIRERVLKAPQTRRTRRPSIEVQAVARLQGELNRVGGNIHQLLRRVNFGNNTPGKDEITTAFAGYREAIAAILETLGRGRR